MAMGAAIVASDTPPVAEVMAHQVNGHLVPFFDVPLWVQAIVHLLDHPAERERLGRQARQTMVENTTCTRCVCPSNWPGCMPC